MLSSRFAAQHPTRERMAWRSEMSSLRIDWPLQFFHSSTCMWCACAPLCTVNAEVTGSGQQQTRVLLCAIRTSVPYPLLGTFTYFLYETSVS